MQKHGQGETHKMHGQKTSTRKGMKLSKRSIDGYGEIHMQMEPQIMMTTTTTKPLFPSTWGKSSTWSHQLHK